MKRLSYTKRVTVLLLLLIATGSFLLWYSNYASDVIKHSENEQSAIVQRFLDSALAADNSMVYVALKDDSTEQYLLAKRKTLYGENIAIEAKSVKSELDYLYGMERKNIRKQYAIGFTLAFVILSICTLIAGIIIRMIFRNAIRKG